jgi:hypothetical protein
MFPLAPGYGSAIIGGHGISCCHPVATPNTEPDLFTAAKYKDVFSRDQPRRYGRFGLTIRNVRSTGLTVLEAFIAVIGDRTKAQTTKALTTIPHRQNRSNHNYYRKLCTEMDNSTAQLGLVNYSFC